MATCLMRRMGARRQGCRRCPLPLRVKPGRFPWGNGVAARSSGKRVLASAPSSGLGERSLGEQRQRPTSEARNLRYHPWAVDRNRRPEHRRRHSAKESIAWVY